MTNDIWKMTWKMRLDNFDVTQIFPGAPAVAQPRVAHTYNPLASYRSATCEIVQCDEIDSPACDRKQPRQLAPRVAAPMTNLYRDSNGSVRRGCDEPNQTQQRPTFATGVPPMRSIDRALKILQARDVSYQ